MASLPQSQVDALIIGAGPAGLMCANALANAQVNVRIVDKRSTQVTTGQADGIAPRTMEVLQSYGLAERLLREGCQVHMAAFYDPGPDGGLQLSSRAPDITAPSARYPFEVEPQTALHQGAIESIFLDSMKTFGVKVERSTMPTRIELSTSEAELADPTSHPVKVTLEHLEGPDGEPREEIVNAKFVLGADGAHSWVRKTLDISMDGEQTDFIWGVLDMVPETDFPDIRNKSLVHSTNGSCLVVPRESERIRIYIQVADQDVVDPNTGRVDKEKMGPDQLLQVAQRSLRPYILNPTDGIDWWTLYIIGQRVASKFSIKNRIFIAGDACHTHSPKAGQGMNASMNDSHNLAWKLAYVLRGWADMSLLSTYEFERRKYAQDLIAFDKTFATLFSGKPLTSNNADGVSHDQFIRQVKERARGAHLIVANRAFQTFGGFSSGIGVHYGPSIAVVDAYQYLATNLVIGERVPPQKFIRGADSLPYELQDLLPSDFRYKLLVFTGDLEDATQRKRVDSLVKDLERRENFLKRYASNKSLDLRFDIITIGKGKKEVFDFLKVPPLLRPHWSKVLLDDMDTQRRVGGQGYSYYGVADEGAIVVVRPDGYVATIAPLDGAAEIDSYFTRFMKI